MEEKCPRRIVVMIGSDSDLPQCREGLEYLQQQVTAGICAVEAVITASVHRNLKFVLNYLDALTRRRKPIDAIVAGAGWAVLPGIIDAYLRHERKDDRIVVFGAAMRVADYEPTRHLGHLSLTQVVNRDYNGTEGFSRACRDAVEKELPQLTVPQPRFAHERTLEQALALAQGKVVPFKAQETGV